MRLEIERCTLRCDDCHELIEIPMRIKLADELIEFQDTQQADHVCKLKRAFQAPDRVRPISGLARGRS
jgi:hypothetical protein